MRAVSRLARTSAWPSRLVASAICAQFGGRVPRVPAAAAADVEPSSSGPRVEPALQRAHHRRGDAGGVPVHAHDAAERLKPERVAQSREEGGPAVVRDDVFGDRGAERRHPRGEPCRHAAAMQRKIGDAGTLHSVISTTRAFTHADLNRWDTHSRSDAYRQRLLVSVRWKSRMPRAPRSCPPGEPAWAHVRLPAAGTRERGDRRRPASRDSAARAAPRPSPRQARGQRQGAVPAALRRP